MGNRCQTGSVRLKGNTWYGRYRRDVPGRETREQLSLVLGPEMTQAEATRRLLQIIHDEGINTPKHLDLDLRRVTTFDYIADQWIEKRLPALSPSSQRISPFRLKRIRLYQTVLRTDGYRRYSQRRR